jgi:hypothetical protein
MHSEARFHNPIFGMSWTGAVLAVVLTLLFLILLILASILIARPSLGQTYRVIYNFTGGVDGGNPVAGLTMDNAENHYGSYISDERAQKHRQAIAECTSVGRAYV